MSKPHGYFAPKPPSWAKDPFNNNTASKCGDCGSWLKITRPGKSQCPACQGDSDILEMIYEAQEAMLFQVMTLFTKDEEYTGHAVLRRLEKLRGKSK